MIALARKSAAPAALALLLAWRAIGNGSETLAPDRIRQPQEPVIRADLPAAMSFHWARPLFAKSPSVKPGLANQPPSPGSAEQQFRLVGIVADGENRVALIASNDRLVRSQRGSTIGPWKVLEIEARSITLESRGKTKVLYLDPK